MVAASSNWQPSAAANNSCQQSAIGSSQRQLAAASRQQTAAMSSQQQPAAKTSTQEQPSAEAISGSQRHPAASSSGKQQRRAATSSQQQSAESRKSADHKQHLSQSHIALTLPGSQNATGQPCRKVFPGQPWETREPAAKEPAATVMNECCLLLTPSKHIHNACKQTLQAGTSVPAKNHACYHLCLKTAMSTCAN